jgi:VWFA-related protein
MRQQILRCMRTMKPGSSLAIFGLSSQLEMLQGITTDSSLWTRAVTKSDGVTEDPAEQDASTDRMINQGVLNSIGGNGAANQPMSSGMAKFLAHMQQTEADNTAAATDRRVEITLQAMRQLAMYLGGIPGRKNLIWFSGSFPLFLTPSDPLDDRNPQQLGSPQDAFSAIRNYSDAMRKTGEMLAAARVAVYPVYAAGLEGLPSADASNRSSPRAGHMLKYGVGPKNAPTSGSEDDAQFLNDTVQAHNSMRQIAEQTGGEA